MGNKLGAETKPEDQIPYRSNSPVYLRNPSV